MMYKFFVTVVYFLVLYVIAFINARDIREEDAVFGVNRSQWEAILVLWVPVLVIYTK